MKKILLSSLLLVGAMSMSAQNSADFNTLSENTSYGSYKTTNGWQLTNCACITSGLPSEAPQGTVAPTLNGKTSAVGSITSPTLEGGIGTLSFDYTNTFSESNGVSLQIDIQQNGNTVKSEVLTNTSVAQNTLYSFTSQAFDVEGDFTILIKNLSPSKSTKNKDRVSIWNLTWTSFGEGPAVATPTFEMVEQGEGFVVKISCATEGAEIRYTDDETTPTATSTLYTAPIECWMATTYKAIAIKDGETSNVATFAANPPYVLDGFTNLYDFMESMEPNQKVPVIINGGMTVIHQSGNYLFLKAGSSFMASYMLVFGNTGKTLANGDTFNRLEGNFEVYNDQPEITSPKIVGDVTAGTAVEPEELYDLSEVAQYNLNHYVSIENVNITAINGSSATLTDSEGNTCALYNRFDIELNEEEGCKIIGFVTKNRGTMQIWPVEIVGGKIVVAAPTFTPESGSSIPAQTEIVITAEEGAEIYYKVEGRDEDFILYEGYEYAMTPGTLTIEAYAKVGETVSETVTATYTVTKPSPELAWINSEGEPVSEVIWVIDGTPEQQILPEPYGMIMGEPTLTSSNPEVASINMEYMSVEVHKVGETTITLAVEETYQYAAGEASFVLKVISKEDAQNITAVVEFSNPNNDKNFGASAKEQNWETTDGAFVFKAIAAVSGNTYPAVADGQLKLYGSSNNTIAVTAPTGYKIKEVSFNKATGHKDYQDWLPTVDGEACTVEEAATQADAVTITCGYSLPAAAEQVIIGCGGSTKHIRLNSISFVLTDAPSAIEGVEAEATDGVAEYYNLQGVRVENPAAGLYIRRQGGKVAKVIIR